MDATEILRRMLEERGVEWREHEAPAAECIAFFDGNGWHDCWESVDGEVNVTFSMTPEQAIAATLGRGTCHNEDGWCSECQHFLHDGFEWCPWCGRKVVDPTTNDVDAEVSDG